MSVTEQEKDACSSSTSNNNNNNNLEPASLTDLFFLVTFIGTVCIVDGHLFILIQPLHHKRLKPSAHRSK